MKLRVDEGSERKCLDICELSSDGEEVEEGGSSEEKGEEAVYEIVMAVGHVKETWMEVPGNLVAHIKVGPSYHLRKEVSGFHGVLLSRLSYDMSCDVHVHAGCGQNTVVPVQ